jgi:mono/diheme cytochrome c family protein
MMLVEATLATSADAQSGHTSRGRYLTEEVAKCQECHTRRLITGQLDRGAWLKGANLDLVAENASVKSSLVAPDITSSGMLWKRWGEKGIIRYLETGRDPEGKSALAPMPAYKLRHDDAEAIVNYLKSLR